jgi:ApbE family
MTAGPAGEDSFGVFGTTAVLLVTDPAALGAARAIADRELAAVDLAASRFRADSELTALNRADGAARPVSPLLGDLIGAALRAARLTGGAVDPTCGAALDSLGYDRDFEQIRAGTPAGAPGSAAGLGQGRARRRRRAGPPAGRRPAGSRRHGQGLGRGPVRGADRRAGGRRRAGQPGRGHRGRRDGPGRRLARPGHR